MPPLDSLHVLSFGQVISAPSATRLLADLGADVIKVEPRRGEMMRGIAPLARDRRGKVQSGFYTALNCGKRSVALNLKSPEGQAICRRLAVEWADVLVENFTPGKMADFHLDYETLRPLKPRLIYASLTGYGLHGAQSHRRAYDLCVQSEGGLAIMNGEPGQKPHRIGYSVTDYGAGRNLVIGILAALHYRDHCGEGLHVDVSMYDTCVSLTENAIPRYSLTGEISTGAGNRHPAASPHNLYATRDGYINIIAVENQLFGRLAKVMGRSDLLNDPVFGDSEGRRTHADEMDAIVTAWTSTLTTAEAVQRLEEAGLPYGVLRNIRDVVEHPHTQERDMAPTVDQTFLGPVQVPGCPIKFAELPTGIRAPAPLLGQHNREVLLSILGLPEAEVNDLEDALVLAAERVD
jgi:CoA:oxalate CoA-transferase